ncbi:MAG: C45 family autoproteolytic acyltransferase/hydrolase [Chloroflexota bacterium]
MPAIPLPVVKVRGSSYQRGVQHGSQVGDLIAQYPEALLRASADEGALRALKTGKPLDKEALRARALTFLPQMEAFAPHLIEEIRGIADGARVPFADALLINVRAEVLGLADGGCTGFAAGRTATADGSILAGQNLDQNPVNQALQIILHVEPNEGPAMLMLSFAGLVGYPGLNSAGVTFFQNALSTPVWQGTAMPHYLMKRVLLEQRGREGCLGVFRRARLCSSGNYVLADRDGVWDMEVTPDGFAALPVEDDLVVHTNHFLDSELAKHEALLSALPDSADRLPRMRTLLRAERGQITLAAVQRMLSDHANGPASICRHQDEMITISSIVAEPDQGRLHVSVGNPCVNPYVTYSL